ncbi:unnamed protein product [Caenorhabditis angaria]|uniref:Ribosomal RNA-processing protein 42 n=1 Tax=Caenorhabditis angaria TaxID=860376 RepID=A0A9P1IW98_9PELO|nr:unnamed protein product [Caenorhabditis angaria]
MEVYLSDDEKLFLIAGIEDNIRNDGRTCADFRQVVLEQGVLTGTNGSCRVQLGHTTDVLAGIKLELESFDKDSEKNTPPPFKFFVDFSANASSQFAGKGGDEYAEELSAALTTAYSNSYDILGNLKKVQLADGYRWKIYVDVTVLQWNGSVIDAISLGVIGALHNLSIPEVEISPDDGGKVSIVLKRPRTGGNVRDEEVPVDTWKLDVSRCPLLVTVSKIGTGNVIDCTPEEETCIRSQLWVGLTPISNNDFEVTCVKQVGSGLLEIESVNEMISLSSGAVKGLHSALLHRLKTEEYRKPGHSFLL